MGHHHTQKVPLGALVGAALLMAASIALAAVARTDHDASAVDASAAVASVDLRFVDRPDGSVAVLEATTGREVHTVAPGTGGFVRGVLRGMYRTRKLEAMGAEASFRLWRRDDGRLFLDDPESGRHVDLNSFGATNERAFAVILDAGLDAQDKAR